MPTMPSGPTTRSTIERSRPVVNGFGTLPAVPKATSTRPRRGAHQRRRPVEPRHHEAVVEGDPRLATAGTVRVGGDVAGRRRESSPSIVPVDVIRTRPVVSATTIEPSAWWAALVGRSAPGSATVRRPVEPNEALGVPSARTRPAVTVGPLRTVAVVENSNRPSGRTDVASGTRGSDRWSGSTGAAAALNVVSGEPVALRRTGRVVKKSGGESSVESSTIPPARRAARRSVRRTCGSRSRRSAPTCDAALPEGGVERLLVGEQPHDAGRAD